MRTRLLIVLLGVLALVAGACGTEAAEDPAAALAAASQATADAGSAAMAMEITMSGVPGQAEPLSFTAEGVFSFSSQQGRMTIDLGDMLAGLPGVDGQETTVEMIFDGNVIYMRAPFFTAMVGADTPWLRFDLDELGDDAGVSLGQMQQFGQSDPTQFLAFLRGVSDDVRVAGQEDVRGVATTRYEATVDLERAYEEADAVTDRDAFEDFIEQLDTTTVPMTAWIDGDGLLRRMHFEASLGAVAGGATMAMTLELFDYGVAVDVTPPPADQVTDAGELQ